LTPTDEGAADLEERLVNAGQSFTTDSQATKPMQPCDGSLDHPACFAQAAAVLGSASCDLRLDASGQQCQPMGFRIVAAVGLHKLGFALGRAAFAANWRNRIYQRQQLRHVVTIGLGQDYRKGNALRVRKDVMLRAGTTAIGWVRSRFFPAPRARTEELSATAREKSMRSAWRSFESSSWCNRSHTLARCHALSRRQHVLPEPQPISRGNSCGNQFARARRNNCAHRPAIAQDTCRSAWQAARSTAPVALNRGPPSPPPTPTTTWLTPPVGVLRVAGGPKSTIAHLHGASLVCPTASEMFTGSQCGQ
jgi:hypothetical protein